MMGDSAQAVEGVFTTNWHTPQQTSSQINAGLLLALTRFHGHSTTENYGRERRNRFPSQTILVHLGSNCQLAELRSNENSLVIAGLTVMAS